MEIQNCNWSESLSTTMKHPTLGRMFPEQSLWIWNQEPWILFDQVPLDNSSDQTTLFLVSQEQVTTGPRVITQKELSWWMLFLMWFEKKQKDVIVYRDSRWHIHLEVGLDQGWGHCWFLRFVKSTLTGSWTPSPSSLHPKYLILSLNLTMLLSLFTSWLRIQTKPSALITKPCTTSVSGLSSWALRAMVTSIIWCLSQCQVSPPVSDSLVNWTLICENWPSTWFPSRDSTSSCLDSLPWHPVDLNSTGTFLLLRSPLRCSIPRTWWQPVTHDMVDTSPSLLFSGEGCPWRKWTSKCCRFRTRTRPTSWSGFRTMWRQLFVTFHREDSRCLEPSSVTQLPSRNCSSGSVNNSPPCSGERLSSTGTLEREWTRWNSLRLSPTWTIWSPSTNSTRKPLLRMRVTLRWVLQLLMVFCPTLRSNVWLIIPPLLLFLGGGSTTRRGIDCVLFRRRRTENEGHQYLTHSLGHTTQMVSIHWRYQAYNDKWCKSECISIIPFVLFLLHSHPTREHQQSMNSLPGYFYYILSAFYNTTSPLAHSNHMLLL